MAEKMLVTQALDELDLLKKRIPDRIARASFVDAAKHNEEATVASRASRKDYADKAAAEYQGVLDLIERYKKIEAAVVESNAHVKVKTSFGEYTVAAAIALRNRLREQSLLGRGRAKDFEVMLADKLKMEFEERVKFAADKNAGLEATAENMRLSILGKDAKKSDAKPLDVVEAYVRENTMELVDPIDARAKAEAIFEKRDSLIRELDTAIKVSNATTVLEI